MSTMGWMDPKLSNCEIPKCAGCLYGKATCKPWRTKAVTSSILSVNRPGEVVFIDQLTVTTPGLIGQVTGFLTQERYFHATVFLDHFSDLPNIVFQRSFTGEDTVRAKINFEGYARQHDVKVMHYHMDN